MKKYFNGDIIITDPCYLSDGMEREARYWIEQNIKNNIGISSRTYYGDWSCTCFAGHTIPFTKNWGRNIESKYFKMMSEEDVMTFLETQEELGSFCADSGQVCVCLLKDVLKMNPNFDFHNSRPWTTTLIKNFDGEVEFIIPGTENNPDENNSLIIVGSGNIDFVAFQTGL